MYDGPIFVSTWRGTERTLGQLGAVDRSIGKAPQAERALDYEQGKMALKKKKSYNVVTILYNIGTIL